ncbi:MAG: M67 family metallopeptidase [Candidatus Omnitrophota bacterium]|nr:M67 family metallopeptidase [Candidatus Omnitrophota bacterium]
MIILKKELFVQIKTQCIKEFPNEACGILAGRDARIERVYEMTNVDKSPASYFMDAKEQLRVMKEIRNLGLEMLGIYHSHVASAAYPSAHDVEMAFYPDVSYIIISLKNRNNPSAKSFRIIDGEISEEELKIE